MKGLTRACSSAQGQMANCSTLPGFVPHTKTLEMCIRELLYADDSALGQQRS